MKLGEVKSNPSETERGVNLNPSVTGVACHSPTDHAYMLHATDGAGSVLLA